MAANVPLLGEGKAPIRSQTATEQQQFRRQQSDLAALLRSTVFPRTISIGIFLICLTLLKTPKIDGGVPFAMNNEFSNSFALVSVVAISMNLLVFFMQILGPEMMVKWFLTQRKLIIAVHIAEAVNIVGLGFLCWCGSNFSQRRQQLTGMN